MSEDVVQEEISIKAKCSNCGGERNCHVIGHIQQKGDDEDFHWWIDWRLLQCKGCEYVFFQKATSDSESYVPAGVFQGEVYYEHDYAYHYWPAIAKRKRPEWMHYNGKNSLIDTDLDEVLDELYSALDNDLRMLSVIAVRTAFDVASTILGGEAHQFKDKLDALVEKGHIRIIDRDNISSIVDAGNASAHRGWRATAEELDILMDILEGFIYSAFVEPTKRKQLEERAAKMRAGVPRMTKKKKVDQKALSAPSDNKEPE